MKKQSSAYIEMLFENRNKAYGAYDLRVNYENRLLRSFFFALLIAGFFFLVPYVLTQILTQKNISKSLDGDNVLEITRTFVIQKPNLPHAAAPGVKSFSANTTYKVVSGVEEKKAEDQKPEDPGSSSQNSGSATGSDSTFTSTTGGEGGDSLSSEPMSAATVDVQPVFPGGEDALIKFLAKNIRYPAIARENNITGKVYVSFVIDEHGKTENVIILRSLGYGTDDEVIRVINIMPEWKPGKYHNQDVKTAFVMPVFFSLK